MGRKGRKQKGKKKGKDRRTEGREKRKGKKKKEKGKGGELPNRHFWLRHSRPQDCTILDSVQVKTSEENTHLSLAMLQ